MIQRKSLALISQMRASKSYPKIVVTLGDLFTEDRGIAVGVMYPGDHDPDGVPLIKAGDLNGSIINPQPDFRISNAV